MKTLVINFPALMTGGVENICFDIMKYSISQSYRVIWLHRVPVLISDGFREFVYKNVEMIPAKRNRFGKWHHDELKFSDDESVTVLSFTPFDMDNALKLKEKFSSIDITPIYMVANTKGRYYFIEEYYFGGLRKRLYKTVQGIMKNWVEVDAVRFCAESQIEAFEKHYAIVVPDHAAKLIKGTSYPPKLDEEQLNAKARREQFNIVSISRFDFPHKGYLLGLIRAYGRLKEKYPQITLNIIGYGPGKAQVENEISKLNEDSRSSIKLLGEVSKADFPAVLKDMHLNISVAGSVGAGAINGVLSIPAKNFCEGECEVYGFLPKSRNMATATTPGELVDPYIEQVIGMPENEFIRMTKESYDTYANIDIDPGWIFDQKVTMGTFSNNHVFFDRMYAFRDYAYKLGSLLHKELD